MGSLRPLRLRRPAARAAVAALAVALAGAAAACARRVSPLLQPDPRDEQVVAPDTFVVRLSTTRGAVDVQVVRAWAPRGADRFHYLVRSGYYTGSRFFRVLPGFVAQFGANADPRVTKVWEARRIQDDAVKQSNVRGTVAFATEGPNTRTVQLFVSTGNNARLDRLGFTPFGRVTNGMRVVDSLYSAYGEGPPQGKGPDQDKIAAEGNLYLERSFPKLDYITGAAIVRETKKR